MNNGRARLVAALWLALWPRAEAGDKATAAAGARSFTLSTRSRAAQDDLAELQRRIENLQYGPSNLELARKMMSADPDFAMGAYYLSAVTYPMDPKLLAQARSLAFRASDAERRFIEAMALARGDKPEQAVEPLSSLSREYSGERIVHVLLGQVLAEQGHLKEARLEYEAALAVDASTPRVYSYLAGLLVLEDDYAGARAAYQKALKLLPSGTPAGQVRYGVACAYVYEGKPDAAVASLRTYLDEYKQAGSPWGLPEVFIWNSIARIELENGRLDEAMRAYEKGYQSVPGSNLDETEKQIWLGRLHHGKGRTLARMKHYDDAWREAATIRKMIEAGGERGKEFDPSYHYLVGYIALESGDARGAVEQLKQANPDDPFQKLLLGRAYEGAGDKANAKRSYQEVVHSTSQGLERALAYPEAKRRLLGL